MHTSIYPNFVPANVNDLAPGEWALARSPSAIEPYALIMMTDRPCDVDDESAWWTLMVRGGTAGVFYSTNFQSPVAQLNGDIRIPIPLSQDEPMFAADYKPGLLYVAIAKDSVYLVAQRGRHAVPFAVGLHGADSVDHISGWDGLQRIERIEYRAPVDSKWREIARIDTPLDN